MSGHSKWSTIKHQKGAADIKRGKAFTRVSRAISLSVKEGKSDNPESNAKLRFAIEQAKAINMPKDNIKRAVERGMGKGDNKLLETVIYEGFFPNKIAIIIECVTDNKNRTSAEIKSLIEKLGGNMGVPGSVQYLFKKQGKILISKNQNAEEQTLRLIDFGITDIEEIGECLSIFTLPENLEATRINIEKSGFNIKESILGYYPLTLIDFPSDEQKNKVKQLLEALDDHDDVQHLYHNAKL